MIAILNTIYGRPDNVRKVIKNWRENNGGKSEMFFALDDHDKYFDEIDKILTDEGFKDNTFIYSTDDVCPKFALFYPDVKDDKYTAYLAGSDDIEYSKNFDVEFLEVIEFFEKKLGHRMMVLYGDDCLKGQYQATHWLATKEFLDVIGEFSPANYMKHSFLDNLFMNLGMSIGSLIYCNHIKMKHNCPLDGKTLQDDNWKKVYAQDYFQRDQQSFIRYMNEVFPQKVNALRRAELGVKSE